ncbi:hypothetical protein QUA56_13205 [Microcoleus sp. N3A4]
MYRKLFLKRLPAIHPTPIGVGVYLSGSLSRRPTSTTLTAPAWVFGKTYLVVLSLPLYPKQWNLRKMWLLG